MSLVGPRRVGAAMLVVAAALLMLAASAEAGTYTVHSCRTPAGERAPTDGWSFILTGVDHIVWDHCVSRRDDFPDWWFFGGVMRHETPHGNEDGIELAFAAPAATEIDGYTIWREVDVHPSSEFEYSYALYERPRDFSYASEYCIGVAPWSCSRLGTGSSNGPPLDPSNRFQRTNLQGVHELRLRLYCLRHSQPGCPALPAGSIAARMNVFRADLTLRDLVDPVLAAPSGTLLDPKRRLTGVKHVSLSASDQGGGIDEALFEVNGTVVQRVQLDANDGRCREPFTFVVPCKLSVSRTLPFDTAELPDGEHSLRILVTDATGTNAAAFGPVRIVTANSACIAPETTGAAKLSASVGRAPKRAGRRVRTVASTRFGRRVRVTGRLVTQDGAPIAGATVCYAARDMADGARLVPRGLLVSDSKGRFAMRTRGPSRTIRFGYRDGSARISAARVKVHTRAGIRLGAERRRLRNYQTLCLRGRLRGRPYPRRGVVVAMQARRGRGWTTFGTPRTKRKGGFRFCYRFTRTYSTRTYLLRALVPRQASYPYARGASRPVRVLVRG